MIDWLWQYSGYCALVSFFVGFCILAVWVYLPRNSSRIESFRSIPFQEDGK